MARSNKTVPCIALLGLRSDCGRFAIVTSGSEKDGTTRRGIIGGLRPGRGKNTGDRAGPVWY